MRPVELNTLFQGTQTLDGIGPRLDNRLKKLVSIPLPDMAPRIADLLWHFPTGLIDRSYRPKIAEIEVGELVTIDVTVKLHIPPVSKQAKTPYRIFCEDETGEIELIFFRAQPSYLEKILPVGEKRILSGRTEQYGPRLQMSHPDHIVSPEDAGDMPLLEPVYPLTAGLTRKVLRRAVSGALDYVPVLDEWQESQWLASHNWPSFHDAIRTVHAPQTLEEIDPHAPARQRLAYDELLANQLALALVRNNVQKSDGRSLIPTGKIADAIIASLPFKLTDAQIKALDEIRGDMTSADRMLRLLQGDVGAGKTIVALLAMAIAVESGTQAAIMAPTEVLARQHYKTFIELADKAGFRTALLTGREKGKAREAILADLAEGTIDILVGTHALFQNDVEFRDLGLAIIDEQHRFGVHQRLALQSKGVAAHADILVMTATPIPRTLLLTSYGDMEVSRLLGKPAGRKPVITTVSPNDRLDEIADGIQRALDQETQVYWVCPLVEESEKLDLAAADQRFEYLKNRFGDKVGLIHGRMKASEKDAVMAAFTAGELGILVATTVIEVGVDVANATIMVIEHAERFGLSQLHQLRGRVGRGEKQSSCILLYQGPLSQNARARLEIMRETDDGFKIAEEDLRLRGGGELLGTKQSGAPAFRVAALPEHSELLVAARDDAKLILSRDPDLHSDRGVALRTMLYLFERDEAVKLIKAG